MVELVLPAGIEVATLQFAAVVEPKPSAPTLMAAAGFEPDAGLPAPSLLQVEGFSTVLVGWLSPLSPRLVGTRTLGVLTVPVPATAEVGQGYRLRIEEPSATSNGVTEVPLLGVEGMLTVEAPLLVCDVAPMGEDRNSDGDMVDAGEFGNGRLSNADVVAIFRASLLPEARPPLGSDQFMAMDAIPEDVPPMCGGDGRIVNNDVVQCFRRSLLPALPNYERVRGGTCTSRLTGGGAPPVIVPQAALGGADEPAGTGEAVRTARPPAEVTLRRPRRVRAGGTVRVPVRLGARRGVRVGTLQFAVRVAAVEGAPAAGEGLRFVPARRGERPDVTVTEGSEVLVGWLQPRRSAGRRRTGLGAVEFELSSEVQEGDEYEVEVRAPSGVSVDGDEVSLGGDTLKLRVGSRRRR
jgi:hypothetical protein